MDTAWTSNTQSVVSLRNSVLKEVFIMEQSFRCNRFLATSAEWSLIAHADRSALCLFSLEY